MTRNEIEKRANNAVKNTITALDEHATVAYWEGYVTGAIEVSNANLDDAIKQFKVIDPIIAFTKSEIIRCFESLKIKP